MSFEWHPSASIASLAARAELYRSVREYFYTRDVLEVDTPQVGQAPVTDPNIEPMELEGRYLHTSPEYAMKRLLCAGAGDIYQICKVFRRGEAGRRHNPEFSMLEWYRVGWDYFRLMDEVAELVTLMLNKGSHLPRAMFTYQQALIQFANLDPVSAKTSEVVSRGVELAGQDLDLSRDGWLDVIVSHAVEPALPKDTLVFIHEFPATQAALAKVITKEGIQVSQRFELFWNGSELANGYQELTDAEEQERRFIAEANGRPVDQRLLAAMRSGLPECAGVAIGLDRILMHRLGVETIAEVLSFDWFQS